MEDGSRKVTRITEVIGLNNNDQYVFRDLFQSKLRGRTPEGRLIAELAPTGQKPTFASQPRDHGMHERIVHSKDLWELSGSE